MSGAIARTGTGLRPHASLGSCHRLPTRLQASSSSGSALPPSSRPSPSPHPLRQQATFPHSGVGSLSSPAVSLPQPALARRPVVVAAAAAAPAAAGCAACNAATATASTTATAAAAASAPWMDVFAVLLGYACLIGSFFRSVPQIAVILRTGSAEGLSLTSNLVELLCFTVTVAYNIQQGYAFNTYGEVFACWIQDAIIVGLIFRHMRLSWSLVTASTAAFAATCAWLFSPMCPMEVLSALQLGTVVVMVVGARVPQIWLNMKRGNAGVLSPLTCLLNVAGCVVRVFTTAVLTRDTIIMGGCITQLILNGILLYQSVAMPGIPAAAAAAPEAAPATAAAAVTAAVAATDPPTGGAGEARGSTAAGLTSSQGSNGHGHGGGTGSGSGGGGGAPATVVPAAA